MSSYVALEDCLVVLNGHTVQGWAGETVAIEAENITTSEIVRGPDGSAIFVGTGMKGVPVIFRLLANSPSSGWFGIKFQNSRQRATEVINGSITINYKHPDSAVTLEVTNGFITNGPVMPNLGTGVATQEYTVVFQQVKSDYSQTGSFQPPPGFGE